MIPLFVELCAGTAALSLRLHGGKHARPPVSRMGNKQGYASAILRTLGLRSGSGAARYLWCEPDDGCRLLLSCYTDAELRSKAAAIIRGWGDAGEDPRALWERLKAEGPVKAPMVDPREVARWCFVAGGSLMGFGSGAYGGNLQGHAGTATGGPAAPAVERIPRRLSTLPTLPATILPDARAVDPREVARWCFIQGRGYHGSSWGSSFLPIEHPINGTNGTSPDCTQRRLSTLPTLPASILPDARAVDPREVARWCYLISTSYNAGDDGGGLRGFVHPEDGGRYGAARLDVARKVHTLPTLPASILPDARAVEPPQLPPGSVVYIDPPYLNTTGYAHDLGRGAVCELAERWASAGAWVVISEAEPLAELDGWHQVEITGERVGQKRTFSKQQREYLTMSRPPLWRPAVQSSLFSMAAK